MRLIRSKFVLVIFWLAIAVLWALPAIGQRQENPELPARGVVIDIDSPEQALYRIAVPDIQASGNMGKQAADVIRNDLTLVSLFNVLDPRSFVDSQGSALAISKKDWSVVGAQAVVKGEIRQVGGKIRAELRLYELAKGESPTLIKKYRASPKLLRKMMHRFSNEVLRVLTGEPGHFDTRLTFARRKGRGRKDVYVADYDGHGVGRVSKGRGIAMLPSFGPGGIWYSKMTRLGMFITRTGANERPIIRGSGMAMGVAACGDSVYFSSTRSGNAEIYRANRDGSGVQQLTRHRGIDVSPACGPGGKIAFVSNRHGTPQIFTMNGDGSGAKRVTFRGNYNQTPAWCPDPKQPLIAFTGQIGGGMDVFTVNLQTGEYVRLTQGQGINKDPAFSPDCRMVAFYSSRGGIFISNPQGLNQNLVLKGGAETIDWSQ